MNLIQVTSREYPILTFIKATINLMDVDVRDYNWHFADMDAFWPNRDAYFYLEGEAFYNIIENNDYQINWGVISAIPKHKMIKIDTTIYAEGNNEIWNKSSIPQHRNAAFEIVCWDSSSTIFINVSQSIGQKLLKTPGISVFKP